MLNLLITNNRVAWFVVLVCLTGTTIPALAQGEHSRRAGAELRVLLGDVNKLIMLTNSEQNSIIQKGLEDRIRGALAAIDILLRLADHEVSRSSPRYFSSVQTGIDYLNNGYLDKLNNLVSELAENFPLHIPPYKPSSQLQQTLYELHQLQCAGCHDNPVKNVERPAYNLYEQVLSMSVIEFYARMLVGVRGDRVTGIDNPLSDPQIAALIAVYIAGMQKK